MGKGNCYLLFLFLYVRYALLLNLKNCHQHDLDFKMPFLQWWPIIFADTPTLIHLYKCATTMYFGSLIQMHNYNVPWFTYTNVQLQCTLVHLYKCTTTIYVGSLIQMHNYNVRWFAYANLQQQCTLVHLYKCTTTTYVVSLYKCTTTLYVDSLIQMYSYNVCWVTYSNV